MESRLIVFARRESILAPQAIHHAVGKTVEILNNLKHTELYAEIDAAVQRRSEVPFSLTMPIGQLHGVIDLLFQDQESRWHLVDWKTDWFPEEQVEEQAIEHSRQIAIYAAAARQALGVEVDAQVCFLAVRGSVHRYLSRELEEAGREIFSEIVE